MPQQFTEVAAQYKDILKEYLGKHSNVKHYTKLFREARYKINTLQTAHDNKNKKH